MSLWRNEMPLPAAGLGDIFWLMMIDASRRPPATAIEMDERDFRFSSHDDARA